MAKHGKTYQSALATFDREEAYTPLAAIRKLKEMEKGAPIPTVITVYADRSFSFVTKSPAASFLLKKAARVQKGSSETGKVSAGTIKRSQLRDIAEVKMKDLNANDIEAAARIIEGSARAMGLEVTGN